MVKKAVLFGALAVALVYGVLVIVNAIDVSRKGTDETQIRAAIEEMRQATLDRREGGVLEYLSDVFKMPGSFGGQSAFSSDKSKVGDFLRKATVDSLQMDVESLDIQDGIALANVPVSGQLSLPPLLNGYDFSFPDMQIEFRKEMRKRLLIVPDPTWAVIRVHGISAEDVSR
jgi:hypothetical protein